MYQENAKKPSTKHWLVNERSESRDFCCYAELGRWKLEFKHDQEGPWISVGTLERLGLRNKEHFLEINTKLK